MSCYILNLMDPVCPGPEQGKAAFLVRMLGAQPVKAPGTFDAIPAGQVCICVIENAWFDAALVVLTEFDLQTAKYDTDRPRTWLLMDAAVVKALVPERYREEPVLNVVAR